MDYKNLGKELLERYKGKKKKVFYFTSETIEGFEIKAKYKNYNLFFGAGI
jgi:hypothetical protein